MKEKISLFAILMVTLFICSLPLPWNRQSPVYMEPIVVTQGKNPVYDVSLSDQRNLNCMTEALFFEAGVESAKGKEAVGIVILNRTQKENANVCSVLSRHKYIYDMKRCQFSYVCMERKKPPSTNKNWQESMFVAQKLFKHEFDYDVLDLVGKADHYHASYVNPYWSKTLFYLGRVDSHLFYKSA